MKFAVGEPAAPLGLLVRLGDEMGDIDSEIAHKTKKALITLAIEFTSVNDALITVEKSPNDRFPQGYETQSDDDALVHLIP